MADLADFLLILSVSTFLFLVLSGWLVPRSALRQQQPDPTRDRTGAAE